MLSIAINTKKHLSVTLMSVIGSIKNIAKELSSKDNKHGVKGNRKMSHCIDANLIAQYFLSKQDKEAGDCISNLKLQKLLYYAQGFVLAITNKKLFDNDIYAWQHGPVVVDVYENYSGFQAQCIPAPENSNISCIENNAKLKDILDEVYSVYGQFSAWKLRNMTHDEKPWAETSYNEKISVDLMKEFFKTQIKDGSNL